MNNIGLSNIELLYLLSKEATLSIIKDYIDPKTRIRTITLMDAEAYGGYVRLIFDLNGNFVYYDEGEGE